MNLLATETCANFTARRRRGITLLEVLISMFILTIGIMSVAALIPVGRHETVEAAKSDRSAALARRVLGEVRTRGFLDPRMRNVNPEPVSMAANPTLESQTWANTSGQPLQCAWNGNAGGYVFFSPPTQATDIANPSGSAKKSSFAAFAIDPLGVNAGYSAQFPAGLGTMPQGFGGMMRITLWPELGGSAPSTAVARSLMPDEIFRSSDELIFKQPKAESSPAEQNFLTSSASGALKRKNEGDFSYIVTIVPEPSSDISKSEFTVSVVVFYKRAITSSLASGQERSVLIKNLPYSASAPAHPYKSALSSPDWEMQVETAGSAPQATDRAGASTFMQVKPGQYVMLAGAYDSLKTEAAQPSDDTTNEPRYKWFFKWYRVVAAQGEVQPLPSSSTIFTRQVTLAGPDWNPQTDNVKQLEYQTRAYLFDGVVGVYERTMHIDSAYLWRSY